MSSCLNGGAALCCPDMRFPGPNLDCRASRTLRLAGIAGLGTLVALTGCGKRENAAAAGIRTQTLLLGNGAEPADLDPQVITAYTDGNIIMALFEGLTALDEETAQPVPAAAERWEISPDQLTWTFHLRPNLAWSNGEPLTANDFVLSWRRLLTPALGAENAYYLHAIRNAERFNRGNMTDPSSLGLAAPDDLTLIVTLERPTPYFAMQVAQPSTYPVHLPTVVKFDAATRRGTAWTRPGNHVGNGPFSLGEWSPNARVSVVRNPHYRDAPGIRLRGIVFFPTENPDVDERNFRAGQVHATHTLPLAKVGGWRERDPARLRVDPFLQTAFLRFNTTRPPLDDARVRRALSLAIDRETIARTVLRGSRAPAFSLTPPGMGGYTSRARSETDFNAARALLAEAGFADGRGLPVFEIQCRNDEIQPQIAEVLQATWRRELGIQLSLAPSEQKIWLQNQQTLAYAITVGSWVADFPDPVNFLELFKGGGGYNWTGWSNARFDQELAAAAAARDPGERFARFQEAEAELLRESPIAPVFHGAQTYLLDPAVRGWPAAPLGTRRYQQVHLQE
ncbi:MAG: peptide ABC transporter substrate-binding protein [Opitutus sp.]